MLVKLENDQSTPKILLNYQNTPPINLKKKTKYAKKNTKITKISLKPKKWLKCPRNLKID